MRVAAAFKEPAAAELTHHVSHGQMGDSEVIPTFPGWHSFHACEAEMVSAAQGPGTCSARGRGGIAAYLSRSFLQVSWTGKSAQHCPSDNGLFSFLVKVTLICGSSLFLDSFRGDRHGIAMGKSSTHRTRNSLSLGRAMAFDVGAGSQR